MPPDIFCRREKIDVENNDIIYDTLVRIEQKCDEQAQQIARIDKRLAVLESDAKENQKLADRLAKLEADKNKIIGMKEVFICLFSAIISGAGIYISLVK